MRKLLIITLFVFAAAILSACTTQEDQAPPPPIISQLDLKFENEIKNRIELICCKHGVKSGLAQKMLIDFYYMNDMPSVIDGELKWTPMTMGVVSDISVASGVPENVIAGIVYDYEIISNNCMMY